MFGKFGKDKVSQSIVDTVKEITEASNVKIGTSTGTKVLGHRYGNSAAAHRDQTRHSVDTEKGPSKKDLDTEKSKTDDAYSKKKDFKKSQQKWKVNNFCVRNKFNVFFFKLK